MTATAPTLLLAALLLSFGAGPASAQPCLAPPLSLAAGAGATAVAEGDFDEDGTLDLAVVNSSTNNVSILLGNGTGGVGNATFAGGADFAVAAGPEGVIAADFLEASYPGVDAVRKLLLMR